MAKTTPPSFMRYAGIVLVPALLNIVSGVLLWARGTEVGGATFVTALPLLILLSLYSILRPGRFFDANKEETHPEFVVSYTSNPTGFWTIITLHVLAWLAMTGLIGIALFSDPQSVPTPP
jgi:hypothetical protein